MNVLVGGGGYGGSSTGRFEVHVPAKSSQNKCQHNARPGRDNSRYSGPALNIHHGCIHDRAGTLTGLL